MTLRELSQKSGISIAMISFIEHDKRKPSFEVVLCLTKALGITVDEMVVIHDKYHYF